MSRVRHTSSSHNAAPPAALGGPARPQVTSASSRKEVKGLVIFDEAAREGHEQVLFGYDKVSGLKTIIAIHSTALGPALGGTRFYPYRSEEEALADALRLSVGMSYKAAAAGLDLGGCLLYTSPSPRD